MRFTLDNKILSGFGACCLVLLFVGVISFRNSEKLMDTNQWVNHTHEVLYELEQILIASVDAETGMRGYVVTGNQAFLEPFNSSTSRILEHLDKVRELTKDNPAQQKNMDRLEVQLNIHIRHLEKIIELRKKDFEQAKTLLASGEGKRIMDEVRRMIDHAKGIEETLLIERRQLSDEDTRNFNAIFIVLIVVIVLVLLGVYFIITTNLKALRKAEKETADKNWNLTGSGELTKGMQGNKELKELSQIIINHIAAYLNIQIGAIYITDENDSHLKLFSGHALTQLKNENIRIRFGEGLIGQAAVEERMILLTDVPPDRLVIGTGLGDILPENILVMPVSIEGRVVGVIELGSINSFTELQQQYLDIIADTIAIAITSAQSREKVKELLEETQRQAEELEAQQEELRQSNEELQLKTQLLEKSESELKAQQEELHQSNEELEEKANLLEEQKDRLENAKMEIENKARELESTSKYKSEFLANMSHELRTPLNSVLILAQLLTENKNKTLGEKEIEFARNICNSGNDLLNLINEILDLSKVESGKMELDIIDVEIDTLKSSVVNMFGEVARNKSIDFSIQCDEQLLKSAITTDQQRLEQIIRNLLSNAFKFTEKKGKVTLKIEQAPKGVIYKNKNLSHVPCLLFSVADTGIGIPIDKQKIIFKLFNKWMVQPNVNTEELASAFRSAGNLHKHSEGKYIFKVKKVKEVSLHYFFHRHLIRI